MLVAKRDGRIQPISKTKLQRCLSHVGATRVTGLVDSLMKGLPAQLTSVELNEYFSNTAQSAGYGLIAGRLEMLSIHKRTSSSFTAAMNELPLDSAFKSKINTLKLDEYILHENDFSYDLFSLRTLQKSYLMRDEHDNLVERPQYLLMRVAASLYDNVSDIVKTYRRLSAKEYTHATPTMFNAGMPNGQFASCFLGVMQSDSINGIFNTVKQCAMISKTAGGIGLSISNIRSSGSHIKGAMGKSNGIVPMLQVFNATARYVDQGRRRKGSFAIYLEPWHKDVYDFLNLRKNHGDENTKARDLFTALWVPDLFMKRVRDDSHWTLFSPQTVNLQDVHSEEFERKYIEAEQSGLGKTVQARHVWEQVLRSQIETGTPYIMFKDRANAFSNQQHLGTIKSSNLCAEIVEFTSPDEIAVCTLASIALPKFVTERQGYEDLGFDFKRFGECVEDVIRNLDRVIDVTFYPLEEAKTSNMKHRPMGLGVQGLSDVFQMLSLVYGSSAALHLDKLIFEHMYYYALKSSCTLAREKGKHESFEGSPASNGQLQFDLHGLTASELCGDLDWKGLKSDIREFGLRNSLLIALMPTASTAQILGNSEGTDPRTSNLYNRRVMSGEFTVENSVLRERLGPTRWAEVKQSLMKDYGSLKNANVDDETKEVFKTVWEISMRNVIDHAAIRAPFICQSQSMNLYLAEPTMNKVNSMLFYAWKKKLKTGMYYLRSKPKVNPVQIYEKDEDVCMSCSA